MRASLIKVSETRNSIEFGLKLVYNLSALDIVRSQVRDN